MNFLSKTDPSILQDFVARLRAQRLEREQTASSLYNFDFHETQPLPGKIEWEPVVSKDNRNNARKELAATASPMRGVDDKAETDEGTYTPKDKEKALEMRVPRKKRLKKLKKSLFLVMKVRKVGTRQFKSHRIATRRF